MALHLSPSLCLFSTITIIFILVQVPTSVSTIDAKYENCSAPFPCATLENLEYPFWGGGRPEFCGHPVYELNCQGEVAEITIMAKNYGEIYRVLEVNNVSWTLTVAIEDYWDNICPASHVTGYVIRAISIFFGGCDRNVTIPGRLSAFPFLNYTAAANVSEALREGFDSQWNANNSLCDKCKNSGGLCGYDPDTDEFTCYFRDKPYPLTCSSKGTSHLYFVTSATLSFCNIAGLRFSIFLKLMLFRRL
ncbi:LEAF RUST 10 DISEASE-RESISTANCE LOCUS RECEPTOR-LIKE PROTEIN KINASE-like 2.1 [Mangifera indica]|uniref:LEAF RUST 10 DISEASE-RESISTANCE LOCUS RECEPTOR-LIKE PROTEIN KINASE-like 2.1 n=1 Tax=Mangifera indica TaxID=29780 RepID=UPI001CFBA062|nr:LEAF RUST 10 DISEASE-RESISTANCE LOCUS RECEPTOR-LIKE PROTEIN KINASE-like 2.1 [Mangifera indica]